MEKAYKRISFGEALTMLNLKKPEDLLHLASQVRHFLYAFYLVFTDSKS
jgi:hypothetical protein